MHNRTDIKKKTKPAWIQRERIPFLYRIVLCLAWCFLKIFYRHRVYGLEHYYSGAAIIASNHTSFFDPPIVSTSWPQEVHFLARESLFKHRFFGSLIRALNAHPISGDVGDITVFKSICKLLNEGKKLVLFPEGKRSNNGQLGLIKPGIGLLISRTQSAVIPAYIVGAYDAWGKGRRLPKFWGKTACVFGSPIRAEAFTHMDKKAAQQAVSDKLTVALKDLKMWYEAGAKGTPP